MIKTKNPFEIASKYRNWIFQELKLDISNFSFCGFDYSDDNEVYLFESGNQKIRIEHQGDCPFIYLETCLMWDSEKVDNSKSIKFP